MLVEGVHFKRKDAAAFGIGWKALARNISDIAAMGGLPRHAVISVGLDPDLPVKFFDLLFNGMNSAAKKFKVNIVGGDVSRSGKIVIDVSLLGEVERSNLVTRSGAKIGDLILVTGCLGGSIKGRHLDFIPRVEEARRLVRNFKINSMIDISDGLILDLGRILRASKAGAKLYQNAIPVSKDADSFEDAVSGGEDFELLFTMGLKEARRFFKTELRKMKTPVTLIGEIVDKKEGYKIVRDGGKIESLRRGGYLHF
jgi:thiamine-monophosphate kinase